MNSQISLNKNKIIQSNNYSVNEMLMDVNHPFRTKGNNSLGDSHMMIEVDELDSPDPRHTGSSAREKERAQTTKGVLEVNLNMEPYVHGVSRYGNGPGLRNNTKTIVQKARQELSAMERSYLPPSRMSA